MTDIQVRPMEKADIPLYLEWATREHIKTVWFFGDYETPDRIHDKVEGNGYDFPHIILLDDRPIGYLVYCDLFAYKTLSNEPCGVFTDEPPGTYCMDLFIAEEGYLNKGYGTQIVKQFSDQLLAKKGAKRVLIDPSIDNHRAIRCYEKAGFTRLRSDHDGICEVLIMEKRNVEP